MKENPCLVLGMSHIEAITRAIPVDEQDAALFIGLNNSPEVYDLKQNVLNLESLDPKAYKSVFLSIGGNFHNIFGLIESPLPFTVHGRATVIDDKTRTLIPREMMIDHFREKLDRLTKHLTTLREHFSESNIWHICSPPPIESSDHIKRNPGVFGKRLDQGIAPESLRLNLYDIQTEIYAEICESLNMKVITPPASSVTDSGFLKDQFLNNDPTHANEQYGALVWSQIKESLHA